MKIKQYVILYDDKFYEDYKKVKNNYKFSVEYDNATMKDILSAEYLDGSMKKKVAVLNSTIRPDVETGAIFGINKGDPIFGKELVMTEGDEFSLIRYVDDLSDAMDNYNPEVMYLTTDSNLSSILDENDKYLVNDTHDNLWIDKIKDMTIREFDFICMLQLSRIRKAIISDDYDNNSYYYDSEIVKDIDNEEVKNYSNYGKIEEFMTQLLIDSGYSIDEEIDKSIE